jgi:hypothetical protein
MKTTIVGVFDNAVDLDRGLTRLAGEGFKDVISDDGIVADEVGGGGISAFVPHMGQSVTWETREPDRKPRKASQSAVVKAFKEHLAQHRLSDDVIEGYAVTFYHDGKFVIVDADPKDAEKAMKIMVECGATRVNRHG